MEADTVRAGRNAVPRRFAYSLNRASSFATLGMVVSSRRFG
jgi:hypothetical protein